MSPSLRSLPPTAVRPVGFPSVPLLPASCRGRLSGCVSSLSLACRPQSMLTGWSSPLLSWKLAQNVRPELQGRDYPPGPGDPRRSVCLHGRRLAKTKYTLFPRMGSFPTVFIMKYETLESVPLSGCPNESSPSQHHWGQEGKHQRLRRCLLTPCPHGTPLPGL